VLVPATVDEIREAVGVSASVRTAVVELLGTMVMDEAADDTIEDSAVDAFELGVVIESMDVIELMVVIEATVEVGKAVTPPENWNWGL